MCFLQGICMFNQCFFKRLMRPPIIMNVCLLDMKRIGHKKICFVQKRYLRNFGEKAKEID